MFLSVDAGAWVDESRLSQISPAGCGSPMIVPFAVTAEPSGVKPCVCPETRLTARYRVIQPATSAGCC